MPLEKYRKAGLIKSQKPDMTQVKEQLERSRKDMEIARLVLAKDPEWSSTIAYQSMLRAGRALMYAHGYLPAGQAQHKTVVELSGILLGPEATSVVNRFEMMRRRRNVFFYGADSHATKAEAENAHETADQLLAAIQKKLQLTLV